MSRRVALLPDNKKTKVKKGTRAGDLFKKLKISGPVGEPIAALVNNQVTALGFKIKHNCTLLPVYADSEPGSKVYRRSLVYALNKVFLKTFPGQTLAISHSLGHSYYFYLQSGRVLSDQELDLLRAAMKNLVGQNRGIKRQSMAYDEAVKRFKDLDRFDVLELLEQQNDPRIPVYVCGDYTEIYREPLAASTGVLSAFDITAYGEGFLLHYPSRLTPSQINPSKPIISLYNVYREHKKWGEVQGLETVGMLNRKITSGEESALVDVAENLHGKKIYAIADSVCHKSRQTRIVMIAGPSSSGKTTFTKKLALAMRVSGIAPVTISLDDYFMPRHLMTPDKNGDFDLEALSAIDSGLFGRHLRQLLNGQVAEIPKFSFLKKDRLPGGKKLLLGPDNVLLVEGIHALNPQLIQGIEPGVVSRVYVSALTQPNIDRISRISTTDLRLLRRILRDYQFRDNTARQTLAMWPSVVTGERKNIFPYQENADIIFNSALDYELPALKPLVEPLLRAVKPSVEEYATARRLLMLLKFFVPLNSKWVPANSLIREFIGDSSFKY